MSQKKWGVWCRVSGGVTGDRSAWMKRDGKVLAFETKEEAEQEARAARQGVGAFSVARFSYTALPLDE